MGPSGEPRAPTEEPVDVPIDDLPFRPGSEHEEQARSILGADDLPSGPGVTGSLPGPAGAVVVEGGSTAWRSVKPVVLAVLLALIAGSVALGYRAQRSDETAADDPIGPSTSLSIDDGALAAEVIDDGERTLGSIGAREGSAATATLEVAVDGEGETAERTTTTADATTPSGPTSSATSVSPTTAPPTTGATTAVTTSPSSTATSAPTTTVTTTSTVISTSTSTSATTTTAPTTTAPTTTASTTTTLPPVDVATIVGGSGGTEFSDSPASEATTTGFRLWTGSFVDSIRVVTSPGQLPRHGGPGGAARTVEVPDGERIVAVFGRAGHHIDSIGFVTDQGRTLGPYGGNGGLPFTIEAPPGYHIVGLKGRETNYLTAVGIVVQPMP